MEMVPKRQCKTESDDDLGDAKIEETAPELKPRQLPEPAPRKDRRVVISLSTLPSRCADLEDTLVSLASQTVKPDDIVISIPKVSVREKKDYPVEEIEKTLKRVLPGLGRVLIVSEDYGPLTKLMGPLLNERDPKTLIITVDDDQRYDPRFVETLVAGHRTHPEAAVCLCGHVVGKFPNVWGYRCSRKDTSWPLKKLYLDPGTRVDIVSGWCGVLYPRVIFGDGVPHPGMEDLRKNTLKILHRHDDLYISAWLDVLGVHKYVVAYDGHHADVQLDHAYKNSLSMGDAGATPLVGLKHANEFWGVIRALRARGMLCSGLRVKWHQSTTTLATIASALVVCVAIGIVVYSQVKKRNK